MVIARSIALRILRRKCLVPDGSAATETFAYKGKVYDKNKYIDLQSKRLSKQKEKDLVKMLDEYESDLSKGKLGKHPEYYAVENEAVKVALSQKRG